MPNIYSGPGEIKAVKAITVEDQGDTTKDASHQGNAILGGDYAQRIWVGATEDVTVVLAEGGTYILRNVVAGDWRKTPAFRNVQDSGTAATEISVASIW